MKVSLNALFSFFIPINASFLEVWDDICKFYSLNLPLQVNRCSFLSEDHVTYSMKEVPMKKKSPKWTPTVLLSSIFLTKSKVSNYIPIPPPWKVAIQGIKGSTVP